MTDTAVETTPVAVVEGAAPVTSVPEEVKEAPRAIVDRLVSEARLIVAQDGESPLALALLAWDTSLNPALDKATAIAEQLKPKGGPTAAEVKKLIAESTDPEVIERREKLAKLEEMRKAIVGQMHELVGAGTPEIDKETKDALKEEYNENRGVLAKACPALESMLDMQNSPDGVALMNAIKAAIPNLTGGGSSSGGASGTGTSKTRFATIVATKADGSDAGSYGTFSALALKGEVKEDVSGLYELFNGAGGNTETAATFTLSNGWTVVATPKKAAA